MGPLNGIRIIDLGTLFAGPLSATLLGDLGADVIKVEHPKMGDTARLFGPQKDGSGVYWKSLGRNKRTVTLNLSKAKGQGILLQLAEEADVIVENFRPGTLERWNIGYETLKNRNPDIILLRTSAFGPGGPYETHPGYGTLAEAMSGFAHTTGDPHGPPTLPQVPLADVLSGLVGALGILAGLYHRDARGGTGQWIDNTIFEPILRLMELPLSEYEQLGTDRGRTGNSIPDNCPRGAYVTLDDAWVALSGSSTETALRILRAVGREDLASDPELASNSGRISRSDDINEAVAAWISSHTLEETLKTFRGLDAPIAPINSPGAVFSDPHVISRGIFREVHDPDSNEEVKVLEVIPRLSETPGEVRWLGGAKGFHNEDVLGGLLGLSRATQERLRIEGVI